MMQDNKSMVALYGKVILISHKFERKSDILYVGLCCV